MKWQMEGDGEDRLQIEESGGRKHTDGDDQVDTRDIVIP